MYIFELICNIVHKIAKNKNKKAEQQEPQKEEEKEACDHVFLPVDSTKKILACTKCGILIKAEYLKKINEPIFNDEKGFDKHQSL